MQIESLLLSLVSIAVMEFGDKTQLGVLTLSARYKLRAPIFLGAMAAFAIVCTLGVAIGEVIYLLFSTLMIAFCCIAIKERSVRSVSSQMKAY